MGVDVSYIGLVNRNDFDKVSEKIRNVVDPEHVFAPFRRVLLKDDETIVFEIDSFCRFVNANAEETDDDNLKDPESRVEHLVSEVEKLAEIENVKIYYASENNEIFFGFENFNKSVENGEIMLESLKNNYYAVDGAFLNLLEKLPTICDC